MDILDFFPLVGMARPGQKVPLALDLDTPVPTEVIGELSVQHLDEPAGVVRMPLSLPRGWSRHQILWTAPPDAPRGYGLELRLLGPTGEPLAAASTAIDVLHAWTERPRYGFLTDFTPGRADAAETLAGLARYHLNGLQFYDWQYRHDSLLPPDGSAEFVDPLGRTLSLATTRNLLDAAHAAGMAAMPYLAVYAASLDYAAAHPEQRLYGADRQPLVFADFLGIVDPTHGGGWAHHLAAECARTLDALAFDGLHVDQYGEPKVAFNAAGEPVELPAAFVDFMATLKSAHPGKAAVFNAVGNWPIEVLAAGPQDFLYIEIWPPDTGYRDVWRIVADARRLSGGKPVVIALYLPAERPANVRLADAIILASGGTRIELGEGERLLADPYFPKHEAVAPDLARSLRRLGDFAARYGEWLGPDAVDLSPDSVSAPDNVWAIPRRAGHWQVVSLVNTAGLGNAPRWDDDHGLPRPQVEIVISARMGSRVTDVRVASPDGDDLGLQPVTWRQEGERVDVIVPRLDVWSLLALRLEGDD